MKVTLTVSSIFRGEGVVWASVCVTLPGVQFIMRIYWVCVWTWKAPCKVNLWSIHYSSQSSVAMTLCLLGRTLRVWHDSLWASVSAAKCLCDDLKKRGRTQKSMQRTPVCYLMAHLKSLQEGWCFWQALIMSWDLSQQAFRGWSCITVSGLLLKNVISLNLDTSNMAWWSFNH